MTCKCCKETSPFLWWYKKQPSIFQSGVNAYYFAGRHLNAPEPTAAQQMYAITSESKSPRPFHVPRASKKLINS